ncbi:SDR family NAD(P)-dependent oxidoreductase [Mesorhizobium australicum]|uniref:SDR family NAD(P)-dependent oxidoreductase n=1 Tax=Mesorhizobium australicum TaxID=536018 RepID=A0ACC6T3I9_9HYPH
MRLRGKRAVVTGGSDGIGLAIAEAFLHEGADVLIVGRDAGKLDTARHKLTALGSNGMVAYCRPISPPAPASQRSSSR